MDMGGGFCSVFVMNSLGYKEMNVSVSTAIMEL